MLHLLRQLLLFSNIATKMIIFLVEMMIFDGFCSPQISGKLKKSVLFKNGTQKSKKPIEMC